MALRLFRRRRAPLWDPGESPAQPGRRDKPDLAGRRAFVARHVFVHTHLPKTGGSTLTHGIAAIVGAAHSMDLRLNRRVPLDEMSDDDLAGLSLLSGHFSFGVHTRLARTPLYVASVREPVARAVSTYRFLQDHDDHPDHVHVRERDFDTAWTALREAHGPRGDNLQARMVTGDTGTREVSDETLWSRVSDGYFLIVPQPEITRALQRLRAAFGVPWTRIPRLNVSRTPEVVVSTEMRTRILAANRVDTELCARVREDFENHLDRACDYVASHCLLPLEGGET